MSVKIRLTRRGAKGQPFYRLVVAECRFMKELAEQLAAWGVMRVCPLGQMQDPPLTWRHALGTLMRISPSLSRMTS